MTNKKWLILLAVLILFGISITAVSAMRSPFNGISASFTATPTQGQTSTKLQIALHDTSTGNPGYLRWYLMTTSGGKPGVKYNQWNVIVYGNVSESVSNPIISLPPGTYNIRLDAYKTPTGSSSDASQSQWQNIVVTGI
jgi:hypothetical protein